MPPMEILSIDPNFYKGDRVVMSSLALEEGLGDNTITTGIVSGFSRDGKCIYVLRDGHVTPQPWHKSYWYKLSPIEKILGD